MPSHPPSVINCPADVFSNRRAFTLVELLVATAITAVLAGIMLTVVSHVSDLWHRTSGRLGAEAQARLMLDQLAFDLQGAQFRDNARVWLAADILTTTGNAPGLWSENAPGGIHVRTPKPVSLTPDAADGGNSLDPAAVRLSLAEKGRLADARFGVAGVWLRFFTTSRGTNQAADPTSISVPVAVAYQIIRCCPATNATAATDYGYYLHRTEVRPATAVVNGISRPGTLEVGYDITDVGYNSPTDDVRGCNDGADPADPCAIRRPQSPGSIIADNVIDFGLRLYVRQTGPASAGALWRQIFPADATDLSHRAITGPAAPDSSTAFPEVVDVMIRVLTDEGARRIALIESGRLARPANYASNNEWWWSVAEQNSIVHTRRIHLPASQP